MENSSSVMIQRENVRLPLSARKSSATNSEDNCKVLSSKKSIAGKQPSIKDTTNSHGKENEKMESCLKPSTALAVNGSKKGGVSFSKDPAVRFEIGTPVVVRDPKVKLIKSRCLTPYVSKLNLVDDVDDETAEVPSSSIKKSTFSETKLKQQMFNVEKTLNMEHRPAVLPASVKRYMDSKKTKPAATTHVVRIANMKFQDKKELLKQLEKQFEVRATHYKTWAVSELEQRIQGFHQQAQRSAIESRLIKANCNPKDYVTYSNEEIEMKLAQMKQQREKQTIKFCGTITEFTSPTSPIRMVSSTSKKVTTPKSVNMEEEMVKMETSFAEKLTMVSPKPIMELKDEIIVSEAAEEQAPVTQQEEVEIPAVVANQRPMELKPKVNPMSLTVKQIQAELRARGLKISGLKNVVAERLANAYSEEEKEMLWEGHEWIGMMVNGGKIVSWMPETSEHTIRFRILYENGEDEVFDQEETQNLIQEQK